jgi:hypothetical protein
MDELRESSLLFSLEGLMETERERVQREAREEKKRREDELRRVAEVAERRRIAAEQEREARARREALEQQREQLEQQRIVTLKHAIVEKARVEAEGQLRLVEAEQARKHDLALAHIREMQRTSRYRTLSWLSSSALGITILGAAVAYFGWIAPAHAREMQLLQKVAQENEELAKSAKVVLAAEQRKSQALSDQLQALRTRVPVEPPPQEAKQTPSKPPAIIKEPHKTSRDVCVDNGDPLNNCLH